jgi:hypothetical protein
MIYSDSRYANGELFYSYNPRVNEYSATVFRKFPDKSADFFFYEWKEEDRIDLVAKRFFGTAFKWWDIMDYNPEMMDPMSIPPGTLIRIPSA